LANPIDVGLYVHVPFCRKKCFYCDFNTYVDLGHLVDGYVEAVSREIRELPQRVPGAEQPSTNIKIGSIFFGGGTPSLLTPQQLRSILDACRTWPIDPSAEITMEANPDDPTRDYFAEARQLGFNRLSFGVQSFDDALLQRLGRRHDAEAARLAYRRARDAGFDNVSLDLMFALPDQTLEQWLTTLDEATALGPDHLSIYNLTIEEGTAFGAWAAKGTLAVPDDDLAADMYEAAMERLAVNGFRQYEISNWARTASGRDTRSSHNLRYWRNQPYLGVGPGAHSSFGGKRYADVRAPARYLRRVAAGETPVDFCEPIDLELERAETMILGLRLNDGVGSDDFRRRFGGSPDDYYGDLLAELRRAGLVSTETSRIQLTYRGRLVGNDVFCRFLPVEGRQ
jgi:oxygen-independent coproporphyrinogen-3 oxidase